MDTTATRTTLAVAALVSRPDDADLFLPILTGLRADGAEVIVHVAEQGDAGPLEAAGFACRRDNGYLESFLHRSGDRIFLYRDTVFGPESFAGALVAFFRKYDVPVLPVAAGQDDLAARIRAAVKNDAPPPEPMIRPSETLPDGRLVFADIGYERYVRLMGIAEQVNAVGDGPFTLLDIGGEDAAFRSFVPRAEYNAYDGFITATAGVDQPDGAFDVVVAADVFEHVLVPDRDAFVRELVRLAARRVVMSFPCAAADPHEKFLLSMLPDHRWLREHQDNGLPDSERLESVLDDLGVRWERHDNHGLNSWLYAVLFDHLELDQKSRRALNGFLQRENYPSERREPCYRYIYTIEK